MQNRPSENPASGAKTTREALAVAVHDYLMQRLDRHITLRKLTEEFHVSGTQIKSCFKTVYGESIYAYVRAQKMQAAAKLLRETDSTVLEIAGHFGYDNASKFAAAFRDVMGAAPKAYRSGGDSGIN